MAMLLLAACSDSATDASEDLQEQLDEKNPHISGQLRYNYDRRCELPCWRFFVDTLPIAYDFSGVDYIGAQVTAWGPFDTVTCNGHTVVQVFADSVVFEHSDSLVVTLQGRIETPLYVEFGCNDLRFVTDCDTFDYQLKEALLDTLEDDTAPLLGLAGYLVQLEAQYWEQGCHNRMAVIDAIGIPEERSAVGRLFQCDSTLPGCGGDYVLVGGNLPDNWRGVYSLQSSLDLYQYLFTDSIQVWGSTVFPKPFATNYPVLGLDSLAAYFPEPADCLLVIRVDEPRR